MVNVYSFENEVSLSIEDCMVARSTHDLFLSTIRSLASNVFCITQKFCQSVTIKNVETEFSDISNIKESPNLHKWEEMDKNEWQGTWLQPFEGVCF
jgi:ABC-type Mn2+/Zn2+ transport system ATPase subunit